MKKFYKLLLWFLVVASVLLSMIIIFSPYGKSEGFEYRLVKHTVQINACGYEKGKAGVSCGTCQPATPERTMREAFEAWWETHGQFCRAGGGDYEKTFAYRAYQAASAVGPVERKPLTEQQITSIAYDCDALPECVTDKTLVVFVRAIENHYGITAPAAETPK